MLNCFILLEKFKGKYDEDEDRIILDDILQDKDLWKFNEGNNENNASKNGKISMKLEKDEIEELLNRKKSFVEGPHFKLIPNESTKI